MARAHAGLDCSTDRHERPLTRMVLGRIVCVQGAQAIRSSVGTYGGIRISVPRLSWCAVQYGTVLLAVRMCGSSIAHTHARTRRALGIAHAVRVVGLTELVGPELGVSQLICFSHVLYFFFTVSLFFFPFLFLTFIYRLRHDGSCSRRGMLSSLGGR